MSNPPELPNWAQHFKNILARGRHAIEWKVPELWFQAELYSEMLSQKDSLGWVPLPTEVPYATLYPVVPGQGQQVGPNDSLKWCDLCIHSTDYVDWCWVELKVRHIGEEDRKGKAAQQARSAFRKDVAALAGFLPERTATIWSSNRGANFYCSQRLIGLAEKVGSGKHHFVSIYVKLGGSLDERIWSDDILKKEIAKWLAYRGKGMSEQRNFELPQSWRAKIDGHEMLLYMWSL